MRFWDSSALIPLFVEQEDTEAHLSLLSEDPYITAWWGSEVECASAFNRLLRVHPLRVAWFGDQKILQCWAACMPVTKKMKKYRKNRESTNPGTDPGPEPGR